MQSMPLTFFLTKPFQRVTKYPILLKKLFETAPSSYNKDNIAKAIEEIGAVVNSLNEEKRTRENHEKLMSLAPKFKCEKPFDITGNGTRIFVKEGKLLEIEMEDSNKHSKKGEIFMFLFEDLLLLARKNPFFTEEYRLKSSEIFALNFIIVKVDTIPPDCECVMQICRTAEHGQIEKDKDNKDKDNKETKDKDNKETKDKDKDHKDDEITSSIYVKTFSETERSQWLNTFKQLGVKIEVTYKITLHHFLPPQSIQKLIKKVKDFEQEKKVFKEEKKKVKSEMRKKQKELENVRSESVV